MNSNNWFEASQYYNRLYLRDSSDLKIQYNYAQSARLCFDLDLSLKLYLRIAEIDKAKKFPYSYFWIAQILKNKQEYKTAKKWFLKFLKLKSENYKLKKNEFNYYLVKAKIESEACDLAQILMINSLPLTPNLLENNINTNQSEYAALDLDSTLYFSSLKSEEKKDENQEVYAKIYKIQLKNNNGKNLKVLDTNINSSNNHNANICFSNDHKQMIISRCNKKNGSDYTCELYISNFIKNKWQIPKRMKEPINILNANTTQANYGKLNDKDVLFFSSNRIGGEGQLDIWYSFFNDDGTFSEPVNAGKKINTPDDEITPWFDIKKNVLYFSSNYHKGLGAFDIFKSEFTNNGFAEPVNLGYPINSSFNDVYYSENHQGNKLYLSSNRIGSNFENKINCCNDIYQITIEDKNKQTLINDSMHNLKARLKLLVPLTLYFQNDEPDPNTKQITTDKNYLNTFNDYRALKESYLIEYSKGLHGNSKTNALHKLTDFFEDSLESGMNNLIQFSDILETLVLNGVSVKITLKGYCSPLASSDYNKNLAKRRIYSLRNYFNDTKKGFFIKFFNDQSNNQTKISFQEEDIGELESSDVSDDFKDKINSVYSPFAASERKIQIIAVSFEK